MGGSDGLAEPPPPHGRPGPAEPASTVRPTLGAAPRRVPLARRIWPVLVGVVAAIVVVGFVALTLLGSGNSSNGTAPTYSSASRSANDLADGVPGGPWDLVVAAGVGLATATTVTANGTIGSGCTYASPVGGPPPSSIFVPRSGASYSSGGTPWWGMIYFQPSSHKVLLVAVVNGSAEAVLVASGACTSTFENYTTIPAHVVDSSTVASEVWNTGGPTFVSSHSTLTFNMVAALLGGGKSCVLTAGPCWLLEYTPCNPLTLSNSTGSVPVYYALANGTTGALLAALPSTSTCSSSSISLASGGIFGPPAAPRPPGS